MDTTNTIKITNNNGNTTDYSSIPYEKRDAVARLGNVLLQKNAKTDLLTRLCSIFQYKERNDSMNLSDKNCNVTVVDSIMGSGKSTWAINFIKEHAKDKRIMYCAPFLNELERIIEAVGDEFGNPIERNMVPSNKSKKGKMVLEKMDYYRYRMKFPQNKGKSKDPETDLIIDKNKIADIKNHLAAQHDVVATHELFKHFDDEIKSLVEENHYTLILDECLSVIQPYNMKKGDLSILMDAECISIKEDGFVEWNKSKEEIDTEKFSEFKNLVLSGNVVLVNNSVFLWRYPPEIFCLFDEVYVLTYLFEGSVLKYYFDMYGINYKKKSIKKENNKYDLCDYFVPDTQKYKELVDIYYGQYNDFNKNLKSTSFSSTWFESSSNKKVIEELQKNLRSYFMYINDAKAKDILWTSFGKSKTKLRNKGFTSCHIACNCRSTNEYRDRSILAYCVNIYLHPIVDKFFIDNGIKIDQDIYALSEMIQWIWRSRIRDGEKIKIYIPSNRMRRLLELWLEEKMV